MARPFRSPESYVAERTSRDMLSAFLAERGFTDIKDERQDFGETQSQILRAVDDEQRPVALWVRLCWRKGDTRSGTGYSAAQITARVKDGNWEATLAEKIARQQDRGATHMLVVQRTGNSFVYAAAVPLSEVLPIWTVQRDISAQLIRDGKIRRKKNHAMNGSSPTIWLLDDDAPGIGDALWHHAGVRDLVRLTTRHAAQTRASDDSVDDLPEVDYSAIGTDGVSRVQRITSGVPRDPRVREAVRQRSEGRCERAGCGEYRPYAGFIDVHHILGAEKNDRVWTCVALCPNCHREAHMSPERDKINTEFLAFARQWAPQSKPELKPILADG